MITVDGIQHKRTPNKTPIPVTEECLDRLLRSSTDGGHGQIVRCAKDRSVSGSSFAAGDIVYVVSPTRTVYMVVDLHMRFTNLKGLLLSMGSDAFYDPSISGNIDDAAEYMSRFYPGNVKTGQMDIIGLSPPIGLEPIPDTSTGHHKLAEAKYMCPFASVTHRNNKYWKHPLDVHSTDVNPVHDDGTVDAPPPLPTSAPDRDARDANTVNNRYTSEFLIKGTSLKQLIDPDLIIAALADADAHIGLTPAIRRVQITAAIITARGPESVERPTRYSAMVARARSPSLTRQLDAALDAADNAPAPSQCPQNAPAARERMHE